MANYRKKPVVIEAEVYREGIEDGWVSGACLPTGVDKTKLYSRMSEGHFEMCCLPDVLMYPYIQTLEGKHFISKGDYIITGVKGERYPCKPDIFEMTYEKVSD